MKRHNTWEQALADYIEGKRFEPFEYGVNDCCTFISGAVIAMTGEDPMPEFRGQYNSLASSVRALRDIGEGDLESTLDAKFPVTPIGRAQRGDIAFFTDSAGIIVGDFAWFVSDDGLERVPRADWDKAWSMGRG